MTAYLSRTRARRRRGKISLQIIGILLLGLSVSFFLSAWRSLGRSFDGFIVRKAMDSEFSHAYWVYLVPIPETGNNPAGVAEFLRTIRADTPGRRVGVSSMLFEEARVGQRLVKGSFSPFLFLEETRFLDLGIQWGLIGLGCLLVAATLAWQLKQGSPSSVPDEDLPEELDEP